MKTVPSGTNELTISGNIKSIEDSTQIKEAVDALKRGGASSLILKVQDSFSMTSTVIGFLMKQVNIDKMSITMIVGDPRLYQLLEELSLVQPFNIRLVER